MPARLKERHIIQKSGLFDRFYYLRHYDDVRLADIDPLTHFLRTGWKENRNPSALFDTKFYRENNTDITESQGNPLYHFICLGFSEGRKAVMEYDAYRYWCLFNSRRHGLKESIGQFRNALAIHNSGLFDRNYYLDQNPDVKQKLQNSIFWKWRDSGNPLLRGLAKLKTSAAFDYAFHGVFQGRDPADFFSTSFYINEHPDLLGVRNLNPFVHYLQHGRTEGRLTNDETLAVPLSSYMQYSTQWLSKGKGEDKLSRVTALTEMGAGLEETCARLQNIFSQTSLPLRILLLNWQSEEKCASLLEGLHDTQIARIQMIQTTKQKRDDGTMWQDAIKQAATDLLWFVPAGSRCQHNFLETLQVFFNDESVMAAYCPAVASDGEGASHAGSTIRQEKWVTPAVRWVGRFPSIQAMQFHPASFMVRNIFHSDQVKKEDFILKGEMDFRAFLLELLQGGAIAFSNETAQWIEQDVLAKQHPIPGKQDWQQDRDLLIRLRSKYKIPQYQIDTLYQQERKEVSQDQSSKMDLFLKTMNIQDVLQRETQLNIMISILGFSLGGGEIMPIRLANQLKQMGCSVVVHSFKSVDDDTRVRMMLDPSIPVVVTQKIEEMALLIKELKIDVINSHHQANQTFIAHVLHRYYDLHSRVCHIGTSHGMYENFSNPKVQLVFDRLRDGVDHWTYVADKNLEPFKRCRIYDEARFTKIPNGMKLPVTYPPDTLSLGIPAQAFVCTIASRAIPEKGWRQAIKATAIARRNSGKDIHLLLLGDGEVYRQLLGEGVPEYVHLLGFRDDPCDYYAISDVSLIPSYYRSESAPLSLIESLLCHKPVISSDIGDVVQMLSIDGELAGDVFELDNWTVPVEELARLITAYAVDEDLYDRKKKLAEQKSKEFDIANIADQYLKLYQEVVKKHTSENEAYAVQVSENEDRLMREAGEDRNAMRVSVIVPNYNHARYLRQRLDSIYNQTYQNFDVILLDDCSTDSSREILNEYAQKY